MDIHGLGDDDDMQTIVPQFGQKAPVAARTSPIEDPEWEAYQAWKRSKEGATSPNVKQQNRGLPEMVNIQVEAIDNMPPSGHPVGLNGVCYIIKPGVPQKVPRAVVEILRNAKMQFPKIDPITQKIIGWPERMRLPFTILPEDEVEAVY